MRVARCGRSGLGLASAASRLLVAARKRPGSVLGGLVIAAGSLAIVVNALGFQQSRHPAPMFSKFDRSGARPVEPAPTPPTRPLDVEAAVPPPQPPARSQSRDPIGEMIRASETTASASAARPADSEPQRLVASAQRALVKLGYGPLKTDGVLGQGTRQAIERFQRDRGLPGTGELGPRTARELSAQSGIRVE
jgi:hypothetical protein